MNGGIGLADNTSALEFKVVWKFIFLMIWCILDLVHLFCPLLRHPS
jgi:hypothetical protein